MPPNPLTVVRPFISSLFCHCWLPCQELSEYFEQLAYVITLDIPVLLSSNWNLNLAAKIRRFTWRSWCVALVATAAVYVLSGTLIARWTDDPRPWIDAISFSISLSAGLSASCGTIISTSGGWLRGSHNWSFGSFPSARVRPPWPWPSTVRFTSLTTCWPLPFHLGTTNKNANASAPRKSPMPK